MPFSRLFYVSLYHNVGTKTRRKDLFLHGISRFYKPCSGGCGVNASPRLRQHARCVRGCRSLPDSSEHCAQGDSPHPPLSRSNLQKPLHRPWRWRGLYTAPHKKRGKPLPQKRPEDKNFTHLPPRVILSVVSAIVESLFRFLRRGDPRRIY